MTATVSLITADQVEHNLDRLVAQGVEGITGMLAIPEKRGGNLVVPGSHGELHLPAKKHSAASLVLPLWVRGVEEDGSIPSGTDAGARLAFHDNLRELVGLFVIDELVTLRHTLSDGAAREIRGEVTDAVAPDVRGAGRHTLGQVAVVLDCPDPFWSDLDDTVDTATSGAPVALDAFAGASAWMEDLLVEFGPQSNPRLTQPSTGVFVQVNRVITAGQTITVDTSTWQIYGTGGVAAGLYEDLEYGGRGTSRWFALKPEAGGGAPVVELVETGVGSGSVTVTGKRKHKIA